MVTLPGLARPLWIVLALCVAAWARAGAVRDLPPDFDELTYLPAAYRYGEMMSEGRWGEIADWKENLEHPPLVKLVFASQLKQSGATEPDWKALEVGQPMPQSAEAAFFGTRAISAVFGVLQVLFVALVTPLGGLLLALDTYHIKYTSQAYLEAIPGLMAVLAVWCGERALRRRGRTAVEARGDGGDEALSPLDRTVHMPLMIAATVALGLAAAGKYLYAIAGLAVLPFLLTRRNAAGIAVFCLGSLVVFVAADPFLWPGPMDRLWESISFHLGYSRSEHVTSSGMPWWAPFDFLTHSAPSRWHRGVFAAPFADNLLLPLALLGAPFAWRQRRMWLVWAGVGLVFLLAWPTKWPQYTLLVLPPLAVCGGIALEQLIPVWLAAWRNARAS